MSAMSDRYLEISHRHGRPFAAYLVLSRRPGDRSARAEPIGDGLVMDNASDGRAIGLEIVHTGAVTEDQINAALARVNQPPLSPDDLAPLLAA